MNVTVTVQTNNKTCCFAGVTLKTAAELIEVLEETGEKIKSVSIEHLKDLPSGSDSIPELEFFHSEVS